MTRFRRPLCVLLAMLLVFSGATVVAGADEAVSQIIEPEVMVAVNIVEREPTYSLMVQATSFIGPPYRYVVTIGNFSPWPLGSLRVFDRYFSARPDQGEINHEWFPERLEPGGVDCYVAEFANGSWPDGCHQIEIRLADGLDTILMDCSPPAATTIWNVPLSDEMASYLGELPLTLAAPVGESKLGIHVTYNNSPKIMDFARRARPAVIVAVGDLGWLSEVKSVSPETITVGRFAEANQSFEGDPVERARQFVDANASRYLANPGVDYWLGWNEPVIDEIWQMEWYAALEIERTIAMAELGLSVAVGNFSAGTPEADEFALFLPALAVAKEHGGILALHEYSAPTLLDGVGDAIPGLEPGEERGALTLRYRFWYEHFLRSNDLVLPLVIAEAGIDGGVLRAEDIGLMGWRDFYREVPSEIPVWEAAEEYLIQLSWYDDELRRDPYVLGFAIFNVGDASGRWKSFDVTDILPQLADLVSGKP